MLFTTTYILFFAFLFIFTLRNFKRNKKAPPGPVGLPIIGNVLQMGKNPIQTMMNWSKHFGPMFGLNICGQKLLFVNDHQWMREMFSMPAFITRPPHKIFTVSSRGEWGIVSTNGEVWEAHRRFTLRGLRDFGFAKTCMEDLILQEISEVLDWYKENVGKALSIENRFHISVSNSLWTIITGTRNKQGETDISHLMHDFMKAFTPLLENGLIFAPWLRHLIPEWSGYNHFTKTVDRVHDYIDKAFENHKEGYVEDNPRDFMDLYVDEVKKAKPGSPFYKEVGMRHMKASITDLFLAGNETTSITLSWAMLFLTHHPVVQKSLHNEIDRIVGKDRMPSLMDKSSMPYTEAVILEILRKSTLLPFGVMHAADRDEEFKGYLIEKNTWIIGHLNYSLNNPDIWGDPENFRPERFLNEDRTKVVKNDALIPFLVGKRQCLGESLARDTIFLFITSIFQKFNLLPDPDNPKGDFDPILSFVSSPKPYRVQLELR